MGQSWFYIVDGAQQGPVTLAELQGLLADGTLNGESRVWQPEFGTEWRRAADVAELVSGSGSRVPEVEGFTLPRRSIEGREWLLAVADGEMPGVWEALQRAWRRTEQLLFKPIIMARWFSIGFCAWLAYLGIRMGQGLRGFDIANNEKGKQLSEGFKEGVESFEWSKVLDPQVLGVIGVGLVLWAAIMIWMCAIRSRGDFMLMHRWYKPDEQVWRCWHAARGPAHTLFIWRVKVFLLVTVLFLMVGGAAYSYVLRPFIDTGYVWSSDMVVPAAMCGGGVVLIMLVSGIVTHLTKAFAVPIMYWHGGSVEEAWQLIFRLANEYPLAVVRYLMAFYFLQVGVELLIFVLILMTCCLGLIPLSLPFLHVVFLLPVYMLNRGFSTEFVALWRGDLVPGGSTGERL